MKKRILAILLCLFSVFALCGCGSITYVFQIDSASGVLTQGIVFSVSKSEIEKTGKTLTNFKQNVEYVANTVVSKSFSDFESAHEMTEMMTTYDGEQVSYAQIVLWTEQRIDPQKRAQTIWKVDGDTVECSISIRFLSIYAYLYFNDSFPDAEEDDDVIIEQHLFYTKRISEQTSPFANINTNDIANYFVDYFDGEFSVDDMTYTFAYSTPDEKIYSDADKVEKSSSGNYVHYWNWTASQLADNGGKFHTYTIKIKTPAWYALGIVAGLATWLVLWFVCKKQQKPKLKESQSTVIQSGAENDETKE